MRQKLLDAYVDELATGLNRLPAHERVLEVEEIRQHLDKLVADNLELGANEEEATKAAITQFGKARKVGNGLTNAYLRKVNPLRDTLPWALLVALASYKGIGLLASWTYGPFLNQWLLSSPITVLSWVVSWLNIILLGLAVAAVTLRFAPRHALQATIAVLCLPLLFMTSNAFLFGAPIPWHGFLKFNLLDLVRSQGMMPMWSPQLLALAAGAVLCLGYRRKRTVTA